jgi:hypothetical protein
MITEIRTRFPGKIYWALPLDQAGNPPAFLDSVDGIYLLWDAALATTAGTEEQDTVPETSEQITARQQQMEVEAARILDSLIQPLQIRFNKPITIALSYPSALGATSGCALTITGDCLPIESLQTSDPQIFDLSLDLQGQLDAYTAVFNQIKLRNWISGVVSRGYYPPAQLMDPGLSSHGKPLDILLQLWYGPD